MDYEELLERVKNCSKDDLKLIIFEIDRATFEAVKGMNVGDNVKRDLLEIIKDRTYVDMLLVNALK